MMMAMSLSGGWTVRQGHERRTIPAAVPGCVHTDLLAAGKIEDPFYRDNEERLQWIGEADWVYSRSFDVPADLLRRERVLLRCEGLDTLAAITINGQPAGRADNMFRTWEFDVKRLLRLGRNTIRVTFESTLPYIRKRQAQRRIPSWGAAREVAGRAWVRKEPCNFGWDWGPVLVTCGIWREISLVAFDDARLADVHIRQEHTRGGQVRLFVDVAAETTGKAALTAEVCLSLRGRKVASGVVSLRRGKGGLELRVCRPRLWWPNGMGAQPLYDVSVTLLDRHGRRLDDACRRIGLRTLRLVRRKDPWGESFHFAANGIAFFAKGANWIPRDAFVTRLGREDYRRVLGDAAAANMNMLRLWGGGIYEQDDFYDLCDELGICIWHDFMFSCSTYPTFDEAFMASVRAEFEDNIRRVRHHPSIALWCGNNELEQGLVSDRWTDGSMSWADYGKLFDRLLPDVLRRLDPGRDYWPCSPHSPIGERRDHSNPNWGDAHLWDVWHGRKPFEWYRKCMHRFCSEFGFQSFPEPETVRAYTAPADRNITTYVMEHHQRSGIGNTAIMQYMLDWFRVPKSFDMTLWLSQIQHGMAMKYAVEHWRRLMPRSMGTLYWQLNDCWPVASWASIDYFGRWKALQHMARHFYANLLVSGVEDKGKGTVEIHVTSDRLKATPVEVRWVCTDVGGRALGKGTVRATAAARKSRRVAVLNLREELKAFDPRNLIVWLELREKGVPVSSNLVLFARPKHIELQDPELKADVRQESRAVFRVRLSARRPALWAWLEVPGEPARFSDNFFHLRPGRDLDVTVTLERPLGRAALARKLRVRSLRDTY